MLALVTARSSLAYDPDLEPLASAFSDLGERADVVCWDDANVDWTEFRAVFLRSTWDYVDRFTEFMLWLDTVETATRIVNPPSVVRWNIDKRYLAELDATGVPVVPTEFVEVGCSPMSTERGETYVVKPSVGAGASGARRCSASEVASHVADLHARGSSAMVQPYLDDIDECGETALVLLGDGDRLGFDHAFAKDAILRSDDVEREGGYLAKETISARVPSAAELALAETVIRATPALADGRVAYARIDVAPTPSGPVLMELELIEPSIYVHTSDGAAHRTAVAWSSFLDVPTDVA